MIKKILILLITLSFFGNLSAQDLLESTIKGLKKKEQTKTNLIAQSIMQKGSFEPSTLFSYVGNDLSIDDEKYLDHLIRIRLDLSSLQSLEKRKSNTLRLSIPVSKNKEFYLLLEKVNILEPGYYMETSDGRIIYPDQNKMVFYRGIVEGDNSSLVSLTIVDDYLKLLISDEEGNYSINRDQKNKEIWNLYNESKLKIKSARNCGTIYQAKSSEHSAKQTNGGSLKMMVQNIQVDVEADYAMYVANGNNEATVEAYVLGLMNATIALYANEVITMSLSKTFVWTANTGDYPYTAADLTDAELILTRFGQRIQNNLTGNLAHFITTLNTGSTVGIAWTDVLCFGYNGSPQHAGPYGVTADLGTSQVFPNSSQDVLTFAHELGHNIGSPHTHDCEWGAGSNLAIDNCVPTEPGNCALVTPLEQTGTIMSYCNDALLSKGFGTLPGALIRSKYNSAMCISVTAPLCPADTTVSSATTTGNSLASNSVSTSGTVAVNGAAVFSANTINLNAGFEVPIGNCFEANNVGCGYMGVLTCEGGGGGAADGSCNAPHVLTCGQSFMGDNTSSGTNIWNSYNFTGFDYSSIEKVHSISVPANNTATIDMTGMTGDLDLFGGTSCDNTSLTLDSATGGDETFDIVNNTGSAIVYYIIVDGYNGATSAYTLGVTCTPIPNIN